jgi:hypothetical protein
MRDYQVARMTARQALAQLINEGIATARKGAGVYVRDLGPTITRLELQQALAGFEHTAYRLELLPSYAEDTEADALQAFIEGREPSVYPGKQMWQETVRAASRDGRTMQRVHVVTEPLNPYLRFEIHWSYPLNRDAGEDIRILLSDRAPDVVSSLGDYWLLDSHILIRMKYEAGRLVGLTRVMDTAMIVLACRARDAALRHAVPLGEYIAATSRG